MERYVSLGLPDWLLRLQGRLPDRWLAGSFSPMTPPETGLWGWRDRLMRQRVGCFALVFAVLTPCWIGVDAWMLPAPEWQLLGGLRLVASLAFFALFAAGVRERDAPLAGHEGGGWWRVLCLFAIPSLFHLASQPLLAGFQSSGPESGLIQAYTFLPFVLMTGLALFPLRLGEAMALGFLVVLVQCLSLSPAGPGGGLYAGLGTLWLLLLVGSVALLASVWQLRLMAALTRQMFHDPLTGSLSRASLEEMLAHHFALAMRTGAPLSVAFLDLDHFKAINDQFGHDAGDQVLLQAAGRLQSHLRRSALVGRWGGEEFLVVLPGADRGQAFQALSRILGEGLGMRPDGVALTASVGLAERRLDGAGDWRQLVECADSRMYIAKKGGRNRIVAA